ncbi:aminotransferase class I/II-fold pyridoxal phosphate-dependent enzyme [Flavobacteriaceae bacterium TP-CH-4]|uniref:Aminotransferase class I/II-fold pyridoxal phosphate-dependent enzyme n=1 Tax=Pelagihabitans pacificus TaxID=2696054 RepID=A0A967E7F4_9FLAO|nr:aminotransferase class I/II-fold pyridoxal phosphate-dependent enzyme [Pelagihabitans pacificus]NHF61547.1 aminotransferase class I/II-fold pyridoxal phosphate-dependent enzyme [Pelagihabitans pacificus]
MGGTELHYVQEAFKTNWIAPLGPNVTGFEQRLADFLGENVYTAALSSGTAAIHLGLKLLNVGKGDLVLCQSFTFSASANPIKYLGADPVFVDSESDTWNISPTLLEEAIKEAISNGKKPKAIIAVHLYGMPYKVQEIKNISQKYDIPILEDSAEALGSMYHGVKCGSFGDIGVLSFNGNKIITTSGGGALVTKSSEIKERAIFLATQARDKAPHYQHSVIGHNYRMSNVLAGIGRGQMEVLEDRVLARRKNHQIYKDCLQHLDCLQFLEEPVGFFSNRWLTCILAESFEMREAIRNSLSEENIECRPLWKPMHLQPVFENYKSYVNGVSENLFERGLCLPSGSDLTEQILKRITDIIIKTVS